MDALRSTVTTLDTLEIVSVPFSSVGVSMLCELLHRCDAMRALVFRENWIETGHASTGRCTVSQRSSSSWPAAVDVVGDFLRAFGLRLSAVKSEAIMVHPRAAARRHTGCVVVDGVPLPWRLTVRYLELIIDHRLTWYPAVKQLRAAMRRVEGALRALLACGDGCATCSRWGCTLRRRCPRRCTRSHCAAFDRICGDTSTATIDECSACATACPAHPVWRRRSRRPARGPSPSPLICARSATSSASRALGDGHMLSYLRGLPKSRVGAKNNTTAREEGLEEKVDIREALMFPQEEENGIMPYAVKRPGKI
ncbi:hypothetical protein HPB49_009535 [Dermacentor silvarum]|uniref:Uncharacterized protein n=1 Tax=Dermacentor silvarum TaxID=543639 RepID=A0ACB8DYX9_DERSI|nr:hypothetical protein HPB49_009535 [Dermacentor silvarum]